MAACKKCNQQLEWMTTPAGKKMPVDVCEVAFIPGQGNDYALVDDEYYGHFKSGKIVGDAYENQRYILARASHFCTCPYRDRDRD